ncbi:thiamine phosphate synthase [Solibacillus sp. MA9]|uniref:Thiamine-phosphate synthase n=1 Tax=Solibacillus palustris TaxID=2908203 RepID=A0ABS9UAT2_9BACL|nr:thiamine phosphate synthase [Solibacillus sp. MA9]MCH7321451.1 thiamine phosphate synthase [Solibacillus sp. MA9]
MSFKLDKYFIMGTNNCQSEPLIILEKALQAGITMFQWREKGNGALQGEAYEQFALACQQLCKHYKVPFIVNDDVELALKLDADGIHVGQDDLTIEAFRQRAAHKIVGVSVHNMEELEKAMRAGADYVGIGPIFATTSKEDAKVPAGVTFLTEAKTCYPDFPMVAIGGITPLNSAFVREAGADGVAVISAISLSKDIRQTVQSL